MRMVTVTLSPFALHTCLSYHSVALLSLNKFGRFCAILDGIKTGVTIEKKQLQSDTQLYGQGVLRYKQDGKDEDRLRKKIKRNEHLGSFVMDQLKEKVLIESEQLRKELDKQLPNIKYTPRLPIDPDLRKPWQEALDDEKVWRERQQDENSRDLMQNQLDLIKTHVEEIYRQWKKSTANRPKDGVDKKVTFTKLPIEARQDILRKLSKDFASRPLREELLLLGGNARVRRLKASYAYYHDSEGAVAERFPFDMAMRELCAIKAEASGSFKTVTEGFYYTFTIHHSFRKPRR